MAVWKKNEGEKSNIIRSFGNLECYEFHMLQLKFLGNTIVSCRYNIPATLAAPELRNGVVARVEDAIARVVLEHPALRIDVVNTDSKRPAWVGVDRIDFAQHVQWEGINYKNNGNTVIDSEDNLRDIIERRLDEPDANLAKRPGWRVLILYSKGGDPFLDIIFDYSHGLGDGTSGKIFHETLLRFLNATETEARTPALTNRNLNIPLTAKPLPPPIEKVVKFPVSAGFAISTAWRELRPPGFSTTSAAQANWAPIRATPYKTQFRAFNVRGDDLRRILAACRTHKTTLTGLLHALLLVCMASRIPAQDAMAFSGSTALDLRRYVATSPDLDPRRTVADYVSQIAHEFDTEFVRKIRAVTDAGTMDPALVWTCAARVRGEIQKRLDRGLKNDVVGLMKLVPDWRTQFRVEASKPRVYSFVVSNLGVLDGGLDVENRNAESWEITHSVFAISAEVCGAAFQISPISVKNGALCVGCSWQDCVVDASLAGAIVADLELWLQFLGKS
ncbi:alcohol acetyltransferase-domain-containing protein [Xylaria digitata]|nr:alcohol acetyltransferase-domain-containing protein [Xylaria digitata]